MYLIRVLSFIGDVRFNVRGEHVAGCLGRGSRRGLGGYQPGVYVPLKALFLVLPVLCTVFLCEYFCCCLLFLSGRSMYIYDPLHGKTNNMHRRKQRHRSASR